LGWVNELLIERVIYVVLIKDKVAIYWLLESSREGEEQWGMI
jgi:hypothetical protein